MFFTIYPRSKKTKKKKLGKLKKRKTNKNDDAFFSDSLDDDFKDVNPVAVDVQYSANESLTPQEASEPHDKFGFDKLEDSFETVRSDEKTDVKSKSAGKAKSVHIEKPKREKSNKSKKTDSKITSFKEKLAAIWSYVPTGWKYCRKLLKTVRFTDLYVNVKVGREDAHEAAIYYGAVQGVLFNFLGTLANLFTVKIKKADIDCIFTKNTISGELETDIKIRPSAVIAVAVCAAVSFLFIFLKNRRKSKKAGEPAQKRKEQAAEPAVN